MLHTLLLGLFIGWGVAIPLGPINLEMMRRNLTYGFKYGVTVGLGASLADLTYLVLLICGALTVISYPSVLRIISIGGALVLIWFGWKSITSHNTATTATLKPASLKQCFTAGYLVALLSPFNVLFWASLTSQIAAISLNYANAIYSTSIGVLLGTISWVIGLNMVLHITRHKISDRAVRWFNIIGGLVLWGFAMYGLIHVLS